jgi:hypothetical protein
MIRRRQARLLTLSIVLGTHFFVVWLLISSRQVSVRLPSGSLQLIWMPRPALSQSIPKYEAATRKRRPLQARADRTPSTRSDAIATEETNAIHPDWGEELKLAAKNTLDKELAQKKHESDFSHVYPKTPAKPPQFAWNYAATHRVEALPQSGMLIHLGDNCVLALLPLPIVACAIGKQPANGDLFNNMHQK